MGYWVDSPDNPFNQMSWTRGGGGYDNAATHESNDRRAEAMSGAGASALPHYATAAVGMGQVERGGQFVANDLVYQKGRVPGVHVPGPGGGQSAPQAVNTSGDGKRSGSALQVPEGVGPLKVKTQDFITGIMIGGHHMRHDQGWSNADQMEERTGESEFLSPTWFYSWGVAIADIAENLTIRTDKIANDIAGTPKWVADGAISFARHVDSVNAQRAADSRNIGQRYNPFQEWNSARLDAAGGVRMTGGGF